MEPRILARCRLREHHGDNSPHRACCVALLLLLAQLLCVAATPLLWVALLVLLV